MILKLLFVAVIGVLWRLGGWDKTKWSGFRDVLVPIALGVYIGVYHWNILLAILTAGSYNIIRLGYGAYDPEHDDKPSFLAKITKDRSGVAERAIAGALYGLVGTIPLQVYLAFFVTPKASLLAYSASIAAVSALATHFKAKDVVIEPLIGAVVASVIFYL